MIVSQNPKGTMVGFQVGTQQKKKRPYKQNPDDDFDK